MPPVEYDMRETVRTSWLVGTVIVVALGVAAFAVYKSDKTGAGGSGLRSDFSYDLTPYLTTDPKLILYREAAPIATGFKQARALAVGPQDSIYVAGDKLVRVCDAAGKTINEFGFAETPTCLAVAHGRTGVRAGQDSTLYAGVRDHVEVRLGAESKSWPSLGAKAVLTSIAVGKEDVFVADSGNRIVVRYDLNGNEVARIGKRDEKRGVPGLSIPSPYFDVAIGADGSLRLANTARHRVETYGFDGAFMSHWGARGNAPEKFCGCCNPAHFALLPDGSFVTAEKGLCRVKLYDARGSFLGVVAGPEAFEGAQKVSAIDEHAPVVTDLAVDSKGRVLVLDPANNAVRVFERLAAKP